MYSSTSFPGGSEGKVSACNAGDLGSIPGLGRSPGEGNGTPLQYSCLEKSYGWRSLVGCSPWGPKELDMTEWLHSLNSFTSLTHSLICYYKQHCLYTFLYMPLALGHHFLQDVFIRMKYLNVFKTYISHGTNKI